MSTIGDLHIRSLKTVNQRFTVHECARDSSTRHPESARRTRLVQADIAVQLKVSTTPVREALRDLASDQLIRFHPHRGAVVHELDLDELREIYEIRQALEPLAIRLAASRITKKQLEEASELLSRMGKETHPGAWVGLNRKFHELIELAAESPRLAALVKSVQESSALYVAHAIHLDPGRIVATSASPLT